MAQRFSRLLGVALFAFAIAGCVNPEDTNSINSPTMDDPNEKPVLAEYLAYHQDQGLMADMSISDNHFVPHMPYLSGTGQACLERYAELLAATGGRLHYDTKVRDKSLIEARLNMASAFLAKAFPSDHTIAVVTGMPGGRGMGAMESIGGHTVAKQAEPRGNAYNLGGGSNSGG